MNVSPMPNETSARLIRLYRADFGTKSEVIVRMGGVVFAAIALSLVTGSALFIAWLGLYLIQQAIYFRVIDPRRRKYSMRRFQLALVLYSIGTAIFLSVPLNLLTWPSPSMYMPAVFALLGTVLYAIQRENPTSDVLMIDTGFFAAGCAWIFYISLPKLDFFLDHAVLLGFCVLVTYLFFRAQDVELRRQAARRVAERRYAQAQKARALNQFVGGVAHDFNNQITAIMGNLELFELLDDPDERRSAMQQCRIAADRAALTVQQLVASSGRTRLQPVRLEIDTFLKDLDPVLTDLLDPKVELDIKSADYDFQVSVDRDMLETCLIQLSLNAQDAMQGEGRIEIGARRVLSRAAAAPGQPESDPPYIGIYVQDAGPGVSDETLSKLSEPFYTTKGVGAGTGLGLSAVSGFAKQSGGALVLDNALPSGLHVMILLPQTRDLA
ncbi:ATP-binding protein [uncultured Pelagimonas sp.]|uniref:sensor histidine kinase n=1 Tax=uncultured Pelagimonas sp. TaxID=1618102 RepID=UPI00261183AF|nr:ATP-binding protein [uncultured Pelagimonas sp.]